MPASISDALQSIIREHADNRCGYCLSHQQYVPLKLEIEHIIPKSRGGSDDESNLWLACRSCNLHKSNQITALDPLTGEQVALFNPRFQQWEEHFRWSHDGTRLAGLTPCGRATVIALNMNNLIAVTVRRNWIAAGWHPP